MLKQIWYSGLSIILLIFLTQLSGCSKDSSSNAQNQSAAATTASTVNVPQFSAQDIYGNWHHSSEWFGKQPVVINFWGTWCAPCRREIPDLAELYDEYKSKGVVLISIAVKDTPSRVKKFAAANNMDWVLLMAQDQILIDYRATTGIPTTVFIDKAGNEVLRFIGMRDYNTLKQGFEAIL